MIKKLLKKKQQEHEESHSQRHESSHGGAGHDDESNWLVSYADMMTLLCGFFIMLFSMAKMDDPKFDAMKESVAQQFGGEYKSEGKELAAFATQLIEQNGLEKDTVVRVSPSGVSMVFQSTVFFDTLSAEVSEPGQKILDLLLSRLSERQETVGKKYKIVVEGHTDGRPVLSGTFPSNWELSGARAARVVRMFLDKGYSADNLAAIGYADTRPELPHRTPAGTLDETALSKNRRVVIRILDPKVDSIPYPEAPSAPAATAPAAEAAPAPASAPATH